MIIMWDVVNWFIAARTWLIAAVVRVLSLACVFLVIVGGPFCGAAGAQEPGPRADDRLFGVLPNHGTVEGETTVAPLSARQKFGVASLNTFDPYVYPFTGFVAALSRPSGSGVAGFSRQYARAYTDNAVGNMLTSAVLPSVLHQDPRYYERGTGGFLPRMGYAASRTFVTRGDAGHVMFNVSELGGNALAAGFSNAYYPAADRSAAATLTRWGMQVMWDTLSNEMKEFWPDVRRKLHKL
jgi:hypothetical protein